MQNMTIWNSILKFKINYDVRECCVVVFNQYTIKGGLLSVKNGMYYK